MDRIMSIKIAFQKPSTHKTLCLGVFDENELPSPTQTWDKKLKGFLTQSLKNSKFKGKLNQKLILYTPDGSQIILIGLGKPKDQNELHWQKVGSSILGALNGTPGGEGSIEIHTLKGTNDTEIAANIAFGALLKSWRFEKYFTTKKPDELFS